MPRETPGTFAETSLPVSPSDDIDRYHSVTLSFSFVATSALVFAMFFDSPELGIGVRFSGDVDVLRIVFGSPF